MRRPTAIPAALAAVLSAVTLSAVTGAAGASSSTKQSSEPTITVWTNNTVGNLNTVYNHINAVFEAKYHVKVHRITKAFTEILEQEKLALSGPNPPTVVESNQGYGTEGPEVAAHLIIPLTKYAKKYNWGSCQTSTILQGGDFSSNGEHFGSGKLYALSDMIGGPVGVYYNKSLLKRLGVSLPITDLKEFQSVLAKAKAAGMTPIELGNLTGWPAIQYYQSLWDTYAPSASDLNAYVFGTRPATFNTRWTKEAASTMVAWAKDGYFSNGFDGVKYTTAVDAFAKGDALFLISGPWESGLIGSAMGSKAGVILMPEAKAGAPILATNSGTNPYVIAAKATPRQQALGAEYLNFITCSKQASQYFVSQGQLPVYLPASELSAVKKGSLLADWISVYDTVKNDRGSIMFMDLATLQGTTFLGRELQELMANKISVGTFVTAEESTYSSFHKSL